MTADILLASKASFSFQFVTLYSYYSRENILLASKASMSFNLMTSDRQCSMGNLPAHLSRKQANLSFNL